MPKSGRVIAHQQCEVKPDGKRETDEEIFPLQGFVHGLDNSQCVTLHLDYGRFVRFQVDIGAQCNVIPLDIYKKATADATLTKITPSHTQVTAYGGNNLPVVGTVLLRVQRGRLRGCLECKIIDHSGIHTPDWSQSLLRNENYNLPGQ